MYRYFTFTLVVEELNAHQLFGGLYRTYERKITTGVRKMRLLIRLRAEADAAYDHAYHNKLRGRLWRGFEDTVLGDEHGDGNPPGFVFSNIFPWGDIEEGDQRNVLVASVREQPLAELAHSLKQDREFNVGEMPFTVTDLSVIDPDIGGPGKAGTIMTSTGVVVRFYGHHREEYGIDPDGDPNPDTPTFWRPEHAVGPFRDAIKENLERKHERFASDYLPGPEEFEEPLFDGYELIKTYSLPVTVTTGVEQEMVVSKWRFDYRVRDDHHRRHLNLALGTGLGGRNGLGFGFLNIPEGETGDAA